MRHPWIGQIEPLLGVHCWGKEGTVEGWEYNSYQSLDGQTSPHGEWAFLDFQVVSPHSSGQPLGIQDLTHHLHLDTMRGDKLTWFWLVGPGDWSCDSGGPMHWVWWGNAQVQAQPDRVRVSEKTGGGRTHRGSSLSMWRAQGEQVGSRKWGRT